MRIQFSLRTLFFVTVVLAPVVGLVAREMYIDRVLGKVMDERQTIILNKLRALVAKYQAEYKSPDDHHLFVVGAAAGSSSSSSPGENWDIEWVVELYRKEDKFTSAEKLFAVRLQSTRTGTNVPTIKIVKLTGPRATDVRSELNALCVNHEWECEE